ncbi:MAG: hypothetical protein U1E23_09650 [Reyranellaceae bacterium]
MTTIKTIIEGKVEWQGSVAEFVRFGSLKGMRRWQVEQLKTTGSVVLNQNPRIEIKMEAGR